MEDRKGQNGLLKNLLCVILVTTGVVIPPCLFANKVSSVGDGDWNSTSTWNCSCTPANTDTVKILSGDTVTLGNDQTVAKLKVKDGGALDDGGNGKNFYIDGDLTLNGHITGQISIYLRQSSILKGSGSFTSPNAIKFKDGPDTIRASADLTFDGYFDLNGGVTVINKGTVEVKKKIQGNSSSDKWIQKQDAVLKAGKKIGQLTLDCDDKGNVVEYFGSSTNIKTPSTPYYHLRFTGSNSFQVQSAITVNGNLTIEATLDGNTKDIFLKGDWLNSGNYLHNGGGKVVLNSNDQQLVDPPAGGEEFYKLKINKNSENVVLKGNVSVKKELIMQQGNIEPSGNLFSLGISTSNPGTLSHSGGNITGRFERYLANTGSFSFPVGTSSGSREGIVKLNSLSSKGSLILEFIAKDPGDSGLPLEDGGDTVRNVWVEGYWSFSKDNGLKSGDYDLDLEGEGFSSFTITDTTPRVIQRDKKKDSWSVGGSHGVPQGDTAQRNNIKTGFPAHFCWGDTTDCDPPDTLSISGDMDVCQGANKVSYTADPNKGSYSYTWTVDQGTIVSSNGNSIDVDWQGQGAVGQVEVFADNSCREGPANDSTVRIHSIPPPNIQGRNAIAKNTTGQPYKVAGRDGYTYNWSITSPASIASGQGTDSITVDFGSTGKDTLEVTADYGNGCPSSKVIDTVIDVYDRIESVQSGQWKTKGTWDCNCEPKNTDNILIRSSHTVELGNDQTCKNFEIEQGGKLDDNNNGKNFFVTGDFTLNGKVSGQIQVHLKGNDTYIEGAGQITSPNPLHFKGGHKTITSITDMQKTSGKAKVHADIKVRNYGTFDINGKLNGGNANSTWVQKTDGTLKAGAAIFSSNGRLIGSATGNTVEYYNGGNTGNDVISPVNETYYHLKLNGTGTNSARSTLTMEGDLIVANSSTFKLGDETEVKGTVEIKDNGVLDVTSNNYLLKVGGNWSNTSAFSSPDPFNERKGRVLLNGGTAQTITNAGDETFSDLELNKSGGKALLSTNTDITVTDSLVLNIGVLDAATNSSLVILPSGAEASVGNTTSYVRGSVRKTGTSAFTFPLGDNGVWARLGISATINGGTVTFQAEYFDSTLTDLSTDGTLNNVSSVEFWKLTRVSGSDSVQVTLHWEDASRSGIDDLSSNDLRVSWFDGMDWTDEGQSSISGTDPGSVTSGNVENYGKLTFGSLSSSVNGLGGYKTTASGNWGDGAIWTAGSSPGTGNNAVIRDGHSVTLTADQGSDDLTIRSGGSLALNGNQLNVQGDLQKSGSFDPGTGILNMNGSSPQTLSGPMKFYDLAIDNGNGVSISSGEQTILHELAVNNGSIDVRGSDGVTLRSDSAGWTARIPAIASSDTIIGKIKGQRWINSGNAGWVNLAAPFQADGGQPNVADWDDDFFISGKTTGGFSDGCALDNSGKCFWSAKYYDPASGDYIDVTDTSQTLTQGKGFELFMGDEGGTSTMLEDTTITVKGGVLSSNKSVSVSTANGSWNLIANPFASQIDFDQLYNNNNIGDTYYVAAATGNYETYQVGTGSSVPSVPDNGAIASSQAFWVTSKDGSDVTFTQSMKTNAPVNFSKKDQATEEFFSLNLKSDLNRFSCRSFVRMAKGSQEGYDGMDVVHRPSPVKGAPTLVFSTSQGESLRWNVIPGDSQAVTLPVRTEVDTSGIYTLKASGDPHPYICAVLVDRKKGEVTDLRMKDSLSVSLEKGENQGRFVLHLRKKDCQVSTGFEESGDQKRSVGVYPNPKASDEALHVALNGFREGRDVRLEVRDMLGRVYDSWMKAVKASGTSVISLNLNNQLPSGVYMVRVSTGHGVYQKRLVIK